MGIYTQIEPKIWYSSLHLTWWHQHIQKYPVLGVYMNLLIRLILKNPPGRSVSKRYGFGEPIHWIPVDRRSICIKNMRFKNLWSQIFSIVILRISHRAATVYKLKQKLSKCVLIHRVISWKDLVNNFEHFWNLCKH